MTVCPSLGMTVHFLCAALSDFQDFSYSALLVSYLLRHVTEETYVMCSLSWALLMQSKSLSLLLQWKPYGSRMLFQSKAQSQKNCSAFEVIISK